MSRRISILALAILFAATSIAASYPDDPTGISPVKTMDSFEKRGVPGYLDDPTGISPVKTMDRS